MPLLPLDEADDWSSEIFEDAQSMFDGELCIIKPGTPGTYVPALDAETGGTPDTVVVDWRPARAQHIRMPMETNDSNGWTTRRRFRFQCEIRDADPLITKGLVVRFRGGKDHTLALLAFQVVSALNSSHAALRTIEATTEGVAVSA